MAFDASADERETRGFISITISRPLSGLIANWMLQPPVSTPTARITAMPTSRIAWYSRSVRVIAGATVIESPVCTPIGSRFSMLQTMTTLSALSRITSSSYSFQPSTDSSISTSVVGLTPQAAAGDPAQLVLVVGEARTDPAHGEGRPHDHRVAELISGGEHLVHGVADVAERATSGLTPRARRGTSRSP